MIMIIILENVEDVCSNISILEPGDALFGSW